MNLTKRYDFELPNHVQENKYLSLYQENINLQEALVRESKNSDKSKNSKMPSLLSTSSKKDQQKDAVAKQSEAYEQLAAKCKAQEDLISKKEEEVKFYQKRMEEMAEEAHKMQLLFEDKLRELIVHRDTLAHTCEEKDQKILSLKEEHEKEKELVRQEFQQKIEKLNQENSELVEQKNHEMDKNLKIEETIDHKNDQILQLEKELQRKADEVNLRKEIIDSMSESLLRHERESAELAKNLVLMKNQIMEHNVASNMKRKYAAVKSGAIKDIPVFIEFIEEKRDGFYIEVTGKNLDLRISFENITSFGENKDGKLHVVYSIPSSDSNQSKFTKKSETFDCFEQDELIAHYKEINSKVEVNECQGIKMTSPSNGQMFVKSQSLSPSKAQKIIAKFV